jgi:hypothetical protein
MTGTEAGKLRGVSLALDGMGFDGPSDMRKSVSQTARLAIGGSVIEFSCKIDGKLLPTHMLN